MVTRSFCVGGLVSCFFKIEIYNNDRHKLTKRELKSSLDMRTFICTCIMQCVQIMNVITQSNINLIKTGINISIYFFTK